MAVRQDIGHKAREAACRYRCLASELRTAARDTDACCDWQFWLTCATEAETVAARFDALNARYGPQEARSRLLRWLCRQGWHWWQEALDTNDFQTPLGIDNTRRG